MKTRNGITYELMTRDVGVWTGLSFRSEKLLYP